MEEEKVRLKLKKQPLESERKEMRQRRNRNILTMVLVALIFCSGLVLGINLSRNPQITNAVSDKKTDILDAYFNEYWLYGNEFEDLSQVLSDKAYYGMTAFDFDPYTTYQSYDEMLQFANSINMNFVGIGVSYNLQNNVATILRVFKDSPAEMAGIMVGDIIKSVNGKEIDGMDSNQIRELVLGEEGTLVKIGVSRQGTELEFAVTRGPVDSTVFAYEVDGIPVLELMSFGENSYHEVIKYLDEYRNSDKLIIDLRDNGGGYQTSVEAIAGLFIGDKQVVMHTIDKHGEEIDSLSNSNITFDNFEEIAILTNENTASAAEVLTICLLEQHPNAYSVGTTTYGKGVVQTTFQLNDGSAIKITTSKWVSPNHVWINGEGIKPTYEVKLHDVMYDTFYDIQDLVFKYDDVSPFVRVSEEALDYLGYDVERTDGYFDKSFEHALNDFKFDYNLVSDSSLDKDTYEAIISAVIKTKSMDQSKDNQLNKAIELIKN